MGPFFGMESSFKSFFFTGGIKRSTAIVWVGFVQSQTHLFPNDKFKEAGARGGQGEVHLESKPWVPYHLAWSSLGTEPIPAQKGALQFYMPFGPTANGEQNPNAKSRRAARPENRENKKWAHVGTGTRRSWQSMYHPKQLGSLYTPSGMSYLHTRVDHILHTSGRKFPSPENAPYCGWLQHPFRTVQNPLNDAIPQRKYPTNKPFGFKFQPHGAIPQPKSPTNKTNLLVSTTWFHVLRLGNRSSRPSGWLRYGSAVRREGCWNSSKELLQNVLTALLALPGARRVFAWTHPKWDLVGVW